MDTLKTNQSIKLPDGRTLAYAEYGSPSGTPVLYFHGAPSSRLEPMLLGDDSISEAGLHMIAPDRPGIGMSDFKPGRSFSDWAADVVCLVDSLGLQRFALLGNSGGGAYVAACAARIPERVTSAVIVSGAWRMDASEVAENLPFVNRIFWILARRFPFGLRLLLNTMRRPSGASRDAELEKMRPHLPPVDFATISEPGRLEAVQLSIQECLRTGTKGTAWDVGLYVRPFELDLSSIRIPIHLFHGAEDRNVPLALVQSAIRDIPTATLTVFPNDAHLSSLCHHIDEIAFALKTTRL
ncbi:alpha/beta fold hydrolase [Granulicella arctica]|uniref:Pimeloyl-ACP methyl ester carboxylesterase n=1 Tax=Granulicella arctica TaxID=940613 RepID=A0A7Y9PEQ3_9BACT|nr:alpha/beta hydrolase [Granulicella arctica]NYF78545.1 pimeloyl-ACP methyl ester carboxylesterase [Granulicella arctica]